MTKYIEFENQLDLIISETFKTVDETQKAIKYFDDGDTIRDLLTEHLVRIKELEEQ